MDIGILSQIKEKNIDGINRSTVEMIKALQKIDSENTYYFLGKTDWLKLPLDEINIIPDYRKQIDLNYLLFCNKLDIVHSHFRPFKFNSKIKCAKIITIHDLIPMVNREWSGIYGLLDGPIRKTAEEADVIITDSESTKRDIINYYNIPESKIEVVYLGIYEKEIIDESNIAENIKRLKSVPYILAVSTMRPYKNTLGLVKAFKIYKDMHPQSELKLVLTGKADQSTLVGKEIIEQVKGQKDIIITGYVSENELNWLYREAFAFAMVSLYEGFGLPVLEALSFGKAVICSDTSSLPELGGEAVEYCDPYDIESIVDAIEIVADNDVRRRQLEEKAIAQAAKFSYEKAAKQTLNIYNRFR